jgi:hypothetical protein
MTTASGATFSPSSGNVDVRAPWPQPSRLAFRFGFALTVVFSALYLGPEILMRLPFGFRIGQRWANAVFEHWMPVVRRVAKDGLHLTPYTGYVDATAPSFNQVVSILCMIVIAALVAITWSALDRRRTDYDRLHQWLRTYYRFGVAIILTSYGIEKVLLNQFDYPPPPSLLMTPVGALSPFWMLVSFTSSSPVFQIFAGAVELAAGLLLMMRRTQALGALLAVGAVANVVVLNFAYHFGMYVLSVALLVMALVLAAPAVPRLINALFDRAVPVQPRRPLSLDPAHDRLLRGIGLVLSLGIVTYQARSNWRSGVHTRPRPALYGAYQVQSFVRNRDTISHASADSARWHRLTVDPARLPSGDGAAIGSIAFLYDTISVMIRVDSATNAITLRSPRNPKALSTFTYSARDSNNIILAGVDNLRGGDSVAIALRRIDLHSLPLLRRQPWFR